MKSEKKFFSARSITYLAILLALVIVLQVFGGYFQVGTTRLSFVLVPITLGGMILGVWAGLFLGLAFGVVVVIDALCGLDAFTLLLINASPVSAVFTIMLCLAKGAAAGIGPALIFKFISKKNAYVATFVAALVAPILNTGVFVIGAFCMPGVLRDVFASLGMNVEGFSAGYIVFVLCVGVNFFVEFAINLICAPAIYTVDRVVTKNIKARG